MTTKQKKNLSLTKTSDGSKSGGIPKPASREHRRRRRRERRGEDDDDDDDDDDDEKKPAWESANRHAKNVRLLKACLVAGLYPNVARVESVHSSGGKPLRVLLLI